MMSRFFQRHRRSPGYAPVLILFPLFFVVILLGRATWNAYGEYVETQEQVARVQVEFDTLSSRAHDLSREVASLQTPEGVEKEIRKKFSVAKEGEQVVVIVDNNEKVSNIQPESRFGFWRSLVHNIQNIFK